MSTNTTNTNVGNDVIQTMMNKEKPSVASMMQSHLDAVNSFFPKNAKTLEELASVTAKAITDGQKILLCGNGGSASDAQHIAAEFVGRFVNDRRALASIALTTDSSILTAIGNDYGYEEVFARQVDGLGKTGDILIAISTSGNSENVMRAVASAKTLGIKTVSLTGKSGGKLNGLCDYNFCVEYPTTSHIQECHITFLHMLCALVEEELGFNG